MGPITIRELLPSDRRAVAFTFGHLSAQSRYQRYFSPKNELAPRELRPAARASTIGTTRR